MGRSKRDKKEQRPMGDETKKKTISGKGCAITQSLFLEKGMKARVMKVLIGLGRSKKDKKEHEEEPQKRERGHDECVMTTPVLQRKEEKREAHTNSTSEGDIMGSRRSRSGRIIKPRHSHCVGSVGTESIRKRGAT